MSEKEKTFSAVTKLNQLTQDGLLEWRKDLPYELGTVEPENVIGPIYATEFKGSKLRLYKKRVESEAKRSIFDVPSPLKTQEPRYVRAEKFHLEFTDHTGVTLWTFPQMSALKDLYSSVSYQVAGVKDFLDNILEIDKVAS